MPCGYKKFGSNDVFYNRVKTNPQSHFFIYDSQIYYNNRTKQSASYVDNVLGIPTGHISLYEMNVDRSSTLTGLVTPFVYKNSSMNAFRAVTVNNFFSQYAYGDKIEGVYPMSSSIIRSRHASGLGTYTGSALMNTFDFYAPMSIHYEYSSSLLGSQKKTDPCNLVTIPSIFYGSSLEKGTVRLRYYMTGVLVGELNDKNRNGELIQVGPAGSNGSGSVAGVVLYNEGFVYLTGSWSLYAQNGAATSLDYNNDDTPVASSWLYFANGANDGVPAGDGHGTSSRASASFELNFSGTNYVPTVTMLAHAEMGELNHSNNLTYLEYNQTAALTPETSSYQYIEKDLNIKNTVSSSFADPTGSFEKITYISKIGIYDQHKNLIGVASVAKPVKKTIDRDLTFKLKLDI